MLSGASAGSAVIPLPSDNPADVSANAKTRATLNYLQLLPLRTDRKVIAGQYMASPACCSTYETVSYGSANYIDALTSLTGKTLGLIGGDYNDYNLASPGTPVDYSALNAALIGYANGGTLITIGWHANNPWTAGTCSDTTHSGPLTDIITNGKAVNTSWLAQLDRVAVGLAALQTAGVTVLWRPFHEANIASTWWGACAPSQSDFAAVWQHMVDYFCRVRGLHNLLWLFSPNNSGHPSGPEPIALYPGRSCVDILGVDDYSELATFKQYGEMMSLGKPVGFGEKGPPSAGAGSTSTTFSTLSAIMARSYPRVTFFQAWIHPCSLAENIGGASLLTDPLIATQGHVATAIAGLMNAATQSERIAAVLA